MQALGNQHVYTKPDVMLALHRLVANHAVVVQRSVWFVQSKVCFYYLHYCFEINGVCTFVLLSLHVNCNLAVKMHLPIVFIIFIIVITTHWGHK